MKFVLLLVFSTTAFAAPSPVYYKPSTINMAKELKKCNCKCKRTNLGDLMEVREFLDQQLQENVVEQPEQKLN